MNVKKLNWWLNGGVSYDPSLQTVIDYATANGITKPTAANLTQINTAILALKAYITTNGTSIWTELDVIQFYLNDGSYQFGQLNMKDPTTITASRINSIPWTANIGFTGGATGSAYGVNTGYNPVSVAGKFTQNSAFIGGIFAPVFGEIATNTSTYCDFGSSDGTRNLLYYYTSNTWQFRLNGTADVNTSLVKFVPAFKAMKRDSTAITFYLGSQTFSGTQASTTMNNNNVGVLCRKTAASQDLFSPRTAQVFFAGSKYAQEGIQTILEAYQTAAYVPAIAESYSYLADYDFNINANLWKDAGKTTHPADGEVIRAVSNANGTWGDLTSASDSVAPLYQTSIINSLNVAEWDGTDDNFDIPAHTALVNSVIFIAVKNDDSANGSHPLSGAPSTTYWAVTGSAYGPGDYSVVHAGVSNTSQQVALKDTADGWNILAYRLYGTRLDVWNGRYLKLSNNPSAPVFDPTEMGTASASVGSTWNMDGYIGRVVVIDGYMSDATIEDFLVSMNTAYGT